MKMSAKLDRRRGTRVFGTKSSWTMMDSKSQGTAECELMITNTSYVIIVAAAALSL
jgi:hypothetical protein